MTRTRHRLQFAAAVLATVGSVYGLSRLLKPRAVTTPAPIVTYVPAPPIVPRVDPPLVPAPPPPPKVSPAFMAAVGEGDIATMEKLYTKGMALDGTLHTAAETGNRAVVAWLLDHEADVHDGEAEAEAPILAADGSPEIVKLLLARGAEEPSLATAAIAGAPNAVSRLLAKHAPVNPTDGTTPLYDALSSSMATAPNRRLIVEKLLAAGANANTGEGAATPMAAALGFCEPTDDGLPTQKAAPPACVPLIQTLAAHGARVSSDALSSVLDLSEPTCTPVLDVVLNARLEPGATAVALSAANGERDATIVRRLSAKGVSWAYRDGEADASAPLIEAIDKLDLPLVRAMLEAGAPADQHLKDGRSALGLALDRVAGDSGDAARIVELLVARGAGVNRRLPDGRTPLFAAAETGDLRVINAMIDHGARLNDVVLDETALDAAERSGHIPAARVLHARGGRRVKPTE
jgi:ankyrin repeat protein